ncbi:hypothetical protein GA0115233_100131 [Streptomyces sp. DI166]|uniref:hypothetical protein n=1 Tax=Streptomyces sp. DI166 TaxID=1839783 RepID=UPI0007F45ADC|nr:hypothetical protein [Streptomyces sp. DI166]SBT88087.1 hypothetical protein GA0115233_100131 [Streptomyces sp. DI166]
MNGLRWTVAASGWVALAATALPAEFPLRVLVTVVFLLTCPGLAVTLAFARKSFASGAGRAAVLEVTVLAGALSLSISALVAEALFLTEVFTPTRALITLAVITSAAALAPSTVINS